MIAAVARHGRAGNPTHRRQNSQTLQPVPKSTHARTRQTKGCCRRSTSISLHHLGFGWAHAWNLAVLKHSSTSSAPRAGQRVSTVSASSHFSETTAKQQQKKSAGTGTERQRLRQRRRKQGDSCRHRLSTVTASSRLSDTEADKSCHIGADKRFQGQDNGKGTEKYLEKITTSNTGKEHNYFIIRKRQNSKTRQDRHKPSPPSARPHSKSTT